MTIHLTSSTLRLYQTCPLKYFYDQVQGYVPKKKKMAFVEGHAFHKGMEEGEEAAKKVFSDYFTENFKEPWFSEETIEQQEARICAMVRGFPWTMDIDFKEKQFCAPVQEFGLETTLQGLWLAGKIDGCYIPFNEKAPALFDYKTKSMIHKGYADECQIDPQASLYTFMARRLYHPELTRFDFIVVRKTAIRRTKKETRRQFLKRIGEQYEGQKRAEMYWIIKTERDDAFLQGFARNLQTLVDIICWSYENISWPANYNACFSYQTPCRYLGLCRGEPNALDAFDVVGPDQHPELELRHG